MTIYFIEVDAMIFGRRVPYWAERDPKSNGRSSTVYDIQCGEVANVRRVIEVDLEDGTCGDVSEDIALDILANLDAPPSLSLRDFLEEHAMEAVMEKFGVGA